MLVKTTMKYQSTPFLMANIEGKKTDGDKGWLARMGSNRNSHLVLMDMQNSRALLENSLFMSYKVKHRFTYDSSDIFLSRYFPK